ncbi:hypothetical protein TNCV_3053931 [Trichonephila clavipes]|nr:hypothetical protein TNCV_3053931 [Trichonephila clavipes]
MRWTNPRSRTRGWCCRIVGSIPTEGLPCEELMHVNSVEAESPYVGVVWKLGKGNSNSGYRPLHLTMVQIDEVRHQKPSSSLIVRR